LKPLSKSIGKTLEGTGVDNNLLSKISVALDIISRIDKWDFIKLKPSAQQRKQTTRIKRQPTEWEKMIANYSTDKEQIFRVYKELQKLSTKRTDNPINKWANGLNRQLSK
jgi:adenylate kinase family enzyme